MKSFQNGLAALTLLICLTSGSHMVLHSELYQVRKTIEARANSRYVFAHLIVGITSGRSSAADWDADMQRAKAYGIDAFALNIGTDLFTDTQLGYAYASAANNGMKVFISFDFNFWSTGSANTIGQMIAQYGSKSAQLMVDNKVFASTFVGDGVDVAAIRSAAGVPVYFAPNFCPSQGTSMSPVDGALNWMGWPNNGNNRAPNSGQTGTVEAGDSHFISALNGKDYIAPVSPWFFNHYGAEVSYSKNWLFPSDLLWYQRWTELLKVNARFVEIITWNDYGESHYVGPLSSPHTDDGSSKWVNDMPHGGWLDMAKPFIAAFRAGASSVNNYITSDQLIYWYRPQPMNTNCDATDTCMQPVNNPDYYIGPPNGWQTVTDNVFVVALLQSGGTLQVTSGENTKTFDAPAGVSAFSVPMGVGKQSFSLSRNSQTVLSATSLKDIIDGCVCGIYNFNAYVGTVPDGPSDALQGDGLARFATGLRVSTCSATPSLGKATAAPTSSQPTASTQSSASSTGIIATLSSTTPSATTTSTVSTTNLIKPTTTTTSTPCTAPTTTKPTTTSNATSTTAKPSTTTATTTTTIIKTSTTTTTTTTTSLSPPSATACTAGQGAGNYSGLCSFCCNYGYCPPGPCACTATGPPNTPPPTNGRNGVPAPGLDSSYSGLCSFACNHGYCPSGACQYAQNQFGSDRIDKKCFIEERLGEELQTATKIVKAGIVPLTRRVTAVPSKIGLEVDMARSPSRYEKRGMLETPAPTGLFISR